MNLYDLRRWFGCFPPLPEDFGKRDPDRLLAELINLRENRPSDGIALSRIIGFAFVTSRFDVITENLSDESWSDSPQALLHRGQLKFFRAVTENPAEPSPAILTEASADFREASGYPETACEGLAALGRLLSLEAGSRRGMRIVRKLEYFNGIEGRRAAAGLRLFLAELPGTGTRQWKQHLKQARRLFGTSVRTDEDRLLAAVVNGMLGRRDTEGRILGELAERGNAEAEFILLNRDVSLVASPTLDMKTVERIHRFRERFPVDPRSFTLEGIVLAGTDAEAARMAWRGALVLDERHAPAWNLLGRLYQDSWEQDITQQNNTWLEAAGDAYLRAAAVEPLSAEYRINLGIVEREAARPARAVSSLQGALGLVRDDPSARRWLALSWTDLAYSDDMTPEGRIASAGQARREWEALVGDDQSVLFDRIGLCRSLVLESPGHIDRDLTLRLDSLISDMESGMTADSAGELIPLADDFISCGFESRVTRILDLAERFLGSNHRILALRAAVCPPEESERAMELYLSAGTAAEDSEDDFIEWMRRAAATAFASGKEGTGLEILKRAIRKSSGNRFLLRDLALGLRSTGRNEEAIQLYHRAVDSSPMDEDLVDDAVWFSRDSDRIDDGLRMLKQALQANPDNHRLWNQLGVYYMESGWEEEAISSENLNDAVAAYRKALALDPESTIYRGNLGDALRQAGKWMEASDHLGKAVSAIEENPSGPIDAFALNSLARLEDERSYAAEGSESSVEDWESAGEHYRQAVGAGPENPDFLRDYAWWLFRERRLEEAAALYRKASDLDPGDETLAHGESECWRDLGEEKRAIEALDRALRIRPEDPEMLCDMAELLGESGDAANAEKYFTRALGGSSEPERVYRRMASFREKMGYRSLDPVSLPSLRADGRFRISDESLIAPGRNPLSDRYFESALEALSAIDTEPSPEDTAWKGLLFLKLGRTEEAREYLQRARKILPDVSRINAGLGLIHLECAVHRIDNDDKLPAVADKDLDSAVKLFGEAAAGDSLGSEGMEYLGLSLALRGEWTGAREAFSAAWSRERDVPRHPANAGIASLMEGLGEEAAVYLEQALNLQDEAEWQNALGLARLASGRPLGAAEAFRHASLLDPENEVFLANLVLAQGGTSPPDRMLQ